MSSLYRAIRRLVRRVLATRTGVKGWEPYRPEKYYMRGAGPKTLEGRQSGTKKADRA